MSSKTRKTKKSIETDPLDIVKSLSRKAARGGGGGNDSNSGENNSDNSALVSLGNTSFGFNFDESEGSNGNSSNSEQNSEDGDDTRDNSRDIRAASAAPETKIAPLSASASSAGAQYVSDTNKGSSISSLTRSGSSKADSSDADRAAHKAAASNAVESLRNLAALSRKRSRDNDSTGYNSDDDDEKRSVASSSTRGGGMKKRSKRNMDEKKREERNAREKERSFKISKQITEIRNLLSSGGIIVPKGTKSSVLSEAANYIRTLQQHQYRSEVDRHQLVQQMQLIGSGSNGPHAAKAIRHVAAQNGVWSLGNFGGVPPKSAMSFYQPTSNSSDDSASSETVKPTAISAPDYRYVFNSCGVGMAIASMGGAFIDCNQLFTQLSHYTKQELCSMTIFNLTDREDLQDAFDLMSNLISPPMNNQDPPEPIVLRGAMRDRDDLGISVSLIRGEDGVAKCFCVTLIKNPACPHNSSKPVPVSFESIIDSPRDNDDKQSLADTSKNSGPAYATG